MTALAIICFGVALACFLLAAAERAPRRVALVPLGMAAWVLYYLVAALDQGLGR